MPVTESATEPGARLASYVDRIVRAGNPADSQVQAPTKYGLAINFKAAKALGLEVPPTFRPRRHRGKSGRAANAPPCRQMRPPNVRVMLALLLKADIRYKRTDLSDGAI
jgi:hypothetical protein